MEFASSTLNWDVNTSNVIDITPEPAGSTSQVPSVSTEGPVCPGKPPDYMQFGICTVILIACVLGGAPSNICVLWKAASRRTLLRQFPVAVSLCVISVLQCVVGTGLHILALSLELARLPPAGEIQRLQSFLWDLGGGVLYVSLGGLALDRYLIMKSTFIRSSKILGEQIIVVVSWGLGFVMAASAEATNHTAKQCGIIYTMHIPAVEIVFTLLFSLTVISMIVFYGITSCWVYNNRLLDGSIRGHPPRKIGRSLSFTIPVEEAKEVEESSPERPVSAGCKRRISAIRRESVDQDCLILGALNATSLGLVCVNPDLAPRPVSGPSLPAAKRRRVSGPKPSVSWGDGGWGKYVVCDRPGSSVGGLSAPSATFHSPRSRQVSSCSSSYSGISQISMGLEMRAHRSSQNSLQDFTPSRQAYLAHSNSIEEKSNKCSLVTMSDEVIESPSLSLHTEGERDYNGHGIPFMNSPTLSICSSISSIGRELDNSEDNMSSKSIPQNAPDILQSAQPLGIRRPNEIEAEGLAGLDEDTTTMSLPRNKHSLHRCSIISSHQLTPIVEGSRTSSMNLDSEADDAFTETEDETFDPLSPDLPPLCHARTHTADVPLRRMKQNRSPSMAFLFEPITEHKSDKKQPTSEDKKGESTATESPLGPTSAEGATPEDDNAVATATGSGEEGNGNPVPLRKNSAIITGLSITPQLAQEYQRRISGQFEHENLVERHESCRYTPYPLGPSRRRLTSTASVAPMGPDGSPSLKSSPSFSGCSSRSARSAAAMKYFLNAKPPKIRLIRPSVEGAITISLPSEETKVSTLPNIRESPPPVETVSTPQVSIPVVGISSKRQSMFTITVRRAVLLVLHILLTFGPLVVQQTVTSRLTEEDGRSHALLQSYAYAAYALVPLAYVFSNKKMMRLIKGTD